MATAINPLNERQADEGAEVHEVGERQHAVVPAAVLFAANGAMVMQVLIAPG